MIVPMYQKLGTDFDDTVRAQIERDRRTGKAYDYNVQQWVQSDHVHVVFDSETAAAKVKTCGATLDMCEPYIAESVRHAGLIPDAEDLALTTDANGRQWRKVR